MVNGSASNWSSSAKGAAASDAKATTKSAWAVQDLYLAHAALTDVNGKRFWYEERLNRAGPGMAGASFDSSASGTATGRRSGTARTRRSTPSPNTSVFISQLKPEKPFVIKGENGVSQKAEGRGRASYYVSFPLLAVSGTINGSPRGNRQRLDGSRMVHRTTRAGSGRMGLVQRAARQPHRTDAVRTAPQGWLDRSVFIRHVHRCARPGQASAPRSISLCSPCRTGSKYPVSNGGCGCRRLNIDLTSQAVLPDQELRGTPNYWEGAVDYSGTQRGVGYLEMTGYYGQAKL